VSWEEKSAIRARAWLSHDVIFKDIFPKPGKEDDGLADLTGQMMGAELEDESVGYATLANMHAGTKLVD
jgi:hypothetical protein